MRSSSQPGYFTQRKKKSEIFNKIVFHFFYKNLTECKIQFESLFFSEIFNIQYREKGFYEKEQQHLNISSHRRRISRITKQTV
jgi:hypothetical protein